MSEEPHEDVTLLLSKGGERAAKDLLPLVYAQLRAMAQQRMNQERPGHTLQATVLVHEAYVRLVKDPDMDWKNRAYFYRAAADAMRLILIEHARARGRVKRGGGRSRVPLNVVDLAAEQDPDQIVALDEGLRRLEVGHKQAAEIVRLRFFAGLSIEQTAEALGISARTVDREWSFARAWLFRAVEETGA